MAELILGENSFVSLDEANEIVNNNYTSFDSEYKFWTELNDSDKQVLLMQGTNLLNSDRFIWIGQRVKIDQPLVFPRKLRSGRIVEFGLDMKIGLVELVIKRQIAKSSDLDILKLSGVTSFSDGGGMSVKFDSTSESKNGGDFIGSEIPLGVFNTYFKRYTMLT